MSNARMTKEAVGWWAHQMGGFLHPTRTGGNKLLAHASNATTAHFDEMYKSHIGSINKLDSEIARHTSEISKLKSAGGNTAAMERALGGLQKKRAVIVTRLEGALNKAKKYNVDFAAKAQNSSHLTDFGHRQNLLQELKGAPPSAGVSGFLHKYKWPLLGGAALAGAGALYARSKRNAPAATEETQVG